MKKLVIGIFCLIGFVGFSQSTVVTISSGHGFNMIPDDAPETTIGSMYFSSAYAPAKIDDNDEVVILRYNAYKDEMEFEQDGNTYYLIKSDNVRINFFHHNKVYQYTSFLDANKVAHRGFLIELLVNNEKTSKEILSLYKRENITYIPARPTTTGYEASKSAEYKKSKDAFFIKKGDEIVAFPKNRRELRKMFPDKSSQISNFLKENNVSFSKEEDLITLTKFLNNL